MCAQNCPSGITPHPLPVAPVARHGRPPGRMRIVPLSFPSLALIPKLHGICGWSIEELGICDYKFFMNFLSYFYIRTVGLNTYKTSLYVYHS
ncbi:unnamed protein product [Lactuca virosa]|uniref:Uncharacterized protein n=1 Tax=Lactuca virosa TaxID=75947 RepID=A0AAU9M9N4_9ASTR|nr:unnamed protein product [Lactuca virosa]